MLILFETAAGYAIFKILDENKLAQSENLYEDFQVPENVNQIIKLKHFYKFEDTTEALIATTAILEGSLPKSLKKALKNCCSDLHEELAVADSKLGNIIKNKLHLPCVNNTAIQELMRCIRSQADSLVTAVSTKEMTAMALGLAHSLSRYKLKFSPDKVDIMVIQAIGLLDELDKQLNNYIMKVREWYGWHFPELSKIVKDNLRYINILHTMGQRENSVTCDLSDLVDEETENQIKEAAQTSMGSEIGVDDVMHMQFFCFEIIELSKYRVQLSEYLTNRMMVLSPNLTVLVGDMVGARLISKAGSLTNLAKYPASTLQILGAEKALFRALKSRKNTPKYGLIYHAQLVGKSSNKNKGKISRMLAAKTSLAARVDALAESTNPLYNCSDFGIAHKAKLELQLRYLEEGNYRRISGTAKAKFKFEKYHSKNEYAQYAISADSTLPDKKRPLVTEDKKTDNDVQPKKKKKKHSTDVKEEEHEIKQEAEETETSTKKKKRHSVKTEEVGESSGTQEAQETVSKKKKKRSMREIEDAGESSGTRDGVQVKIENVEVPKKKKKRSMCEIEDAGEASGTQVQAETQVEADSNISSKKKKKKKKKQESDEAQVSVKIEDTTSEANVSCGAESSETNDGQKKKKKKKKEKEMQEAQEPSVSTEAIEESVSNEKKKKKKKKSKSDD